MWLSQHKTILPKKISIYWVPCELRPVALMNIPILFLHCWTVNHTWTESFVFRNYEAISGLRKAWIRRYTWELVWCSDRLTHSVFETKVLLGISKINTRQKSMNADEQTHWFANVLVENPSFSSHQFRYKIALFIFMKPDPSLSTQSQL